MQKKITPNDLFIILYIIIPLISLQSIDIINIGTFFYIFMGGITLYIYKLNLSIFNFKNISKIISEYLPDKFNFITISGGVILISILIFLRIFKYGGGLEDIISKDIFLNLRSNWFEDRDKLSTIERLISVTTYIFCYYNFLIFIKDLINKNKFNIIYAIPYILLSLLNGSRNMLLFLIMPTLLIFINENYKKFIFFIKFKKIQRSLFFLTLGIFFFLGIAFSLNLSRTIHHKDNFALYKNLRSEICTSGYKALSGENKYSCKNISNYDGLVPLSLNPYYFSHGILNLNLLLKDENIVLLKKNSLENLFYNFTKFFLKKEYFNLNKFRGHGKGGATLFGELIKKYGLFISIIYPFSIFFIKEFINSNIPSFIKLFILNIFFLNLILMPFFEGISTMIGSISFVPIILLPIYSIIISKMFKFINIKNEFVDNCFSKISN